jgi:hypothetical protein
MNVFLIYGGPRLAFVTAPGLQNSVGSAGWRDVHVCIGSDRGFQERHKRAGARRQRCGMMVELPESTIIPM